MVDPFVMEASITIQIYEFDDFLYQTVDDLVLKNADEIARYLQSFLLGVGSVYVTTSTNKQIEWRI